MRFTAFKLEIEINERTEVVLEKFKQEKLCYVFHTDNPNLKRVNFTTL